MFLLFHSFGSKVTCNFSFTCRWNMSISFFIHFNLLMINTCFLLQNEMFSFLSACQFNKCNIPLSSICIIVFNDQYITFSVLKLRVTKPWSYTMHKYNNGNNIYPLEEITLLRDIEKQILHTLFFSYVKVHGCPTLLDLSDLHAMKRFHSVHVYTMEISILAVSKTVLRPL